MKKIQEQKTGFTFDEASVDMISDSCGAFMEECGTEQREVIRRRLGIEEILLGMLRTHRGETGELRLFSKWGQPRMHISIGGERYEPSPEDGEFEEYSTGILANMGTVPQQYFRSGRNHIEMKLPKRGHGMLMYIGAAILAALIVSLILRGAPEGVESLALGITEQLTTTFLGILSTIAGPMIFLSVLCGIIGIGNAASLGKIGKTLISHIILMTTLFCVLALLPGFRIFSLDMSGGELSGEQFQELLQVILDVFPSNVVEPFYGGNSMQIIIIAVALGCALIVTGNVSSLVAMMAEQMNSVVMFLMEILTKLIPMFVFLSLLDVFLSEETDELKGCLQMFLWMVAFCFLFMFLWLAVSSLICGASVRRTFTAMLPALVTALTTASSVAAFPYNVENSEKKLGIDPKLIRFAIPVTMVAYMPALGIQLSVMVMYFAKSCGVQVSWSWIIIALIEIVMLSVATPPIPGGALTCFTILFTQLGIPTECIALACILDIFMDFVGTGVTQVYMCSSLMYVAKKLDMLDSEVLRG